MLEALEGEDERRARYVCVLVAVAPDGREVVAEGTLEGTIARSASGAEGFGFDPSSCRDGESRTVAVLGDEWKRAHSHRARAAAELARQLRTVLGAGIRRRRGVGAVGLGPLGLHRRGRSRRRRARS